ncbi:thymidylate kinase [Cenarchaeum symbiosum A]|uniref:Thymidylate kinase n=1 Tax=Cenarchaeum symbiosum (strain A) TaxID=414004 RepID=A0RXT4_CENSY|nr:thymidylate kinase [Cenarchaeum symbiosum A]
MGIQAVIIVIEGCDQAGKQTQAGLLAGALNRKGRKARVFAFPDYTTPVGKMMKKQLEGRGFEPRVFHCLAAANRWEKAGEIRAASSGGSVAILDRYRQSNMVYGVLNGLSRRWLAGLDAGLPRADVVILLDIKQKEAFRRKPSGRDPSSGTHHSPSRWQQNTGGPPRQAGGRLWTRRAQRTRCTAG